MIVEFKSAGVVKGLLSVIGIPPPPRLSLHLQPANNFVDNAAHGIVMDEIDDWESVTRQLRMYAVGCNVRDVPVMDESVAVYFCFPRDPSWSDDGHQYLLASTDIGADYGVDPRLSVRELVVYALLSAFEKKNIELRHDSHGAYSALSAVPTTRPYRNVLPMQEPPARRRRGGPSTRQQPTKRPRMHDSINDRFDRCFLGATLTFEILPNKLPPRHSIPHPPWQSLDTSFHDGPRSSIPHTGSAKLTPPPINICVTVVGILKRDVALVSDGSTEFIAKLFSPDTRTLEHELAVYAACPSLQGTYIPYLYAVGRVPASGAYVLLIEYIGSGITVTDLITAGGVSELAKLRPAATAALHALHKLKVVHRDVAGRNMVLDDRGGIAMVDFGCARVLNADLARLRIGKKGDEAAMRTIFNFDSAL